MRSSQGAATSDLAGHRTLRVGFSPAAAAARRGAALGRGANAAHALLSAATDTQTASTRMNTRRRMFYRAATDGGQRGTSWELVKWNPDLVTGPAQRLLAQLTTAIESMHQRPVPSLQIFFVC